MIRRLELTPGGPTGRRTLAEEAAAELHELILSGELPSGTALRLEELAKRLDMSQMPIREGLRRMAALGLVEIVPHKGAWVRELSMEDLRDTHETRLALESLAVRAAATQFSDTDASAARTALAEHVRLSKQGDNIASRQAHTEFHFAIYGACRSPWLVRLIRPAWESSARFRPVLFASDGDLQQRHRAFDGELLRACGAHDAEGAAAALRGHLELANEYFAPELAGRSIFN